MGDIVRRGREIGPILRRFFINTLFDSTFTQIGIIIGSAFSPNPSLRIVIGTLVLSSIALGISTGVSVYESETLERERRIIELEKALFRKMDNTTIVENYRTYALIVGVVNFITPLACCAIFLTPLLMATLQLLDLSKASWLSLILGLGILFVAGTYLGRNGRRNPLLKGVRMTMFGLLAFAIGYFIQSLI